MSGAPRGTQRFLLTGTSDEATMRTLCHRPHHWCQCLWPVQHVRSVSHVAWLPVPCGRHTGHMAWLMDSCGLGFVKKEQCVDVPAATVSPHPGMRVLLQIGTDRRC